MYVRFVHNVEKEPCRLPQGIVGQTVCVCTVHAKMKPKLSHY